MASPAEDESDFTNHAGPAVLAFGAISSGDMTQIELIYRKALQLANCDVYI